MIGKMQLCLLIFFMSGEMLLCLLECSHAWRDVTLYIYNLPTQFSLLKSSEEKKIAKLVQLNLVIPFGNRPIMPIMTMDKTGTSRDKTGTSKDRQGHQG